MSVEQDVDRLAAWNDHLAAVYVMHGRAKADEAYRASLLLDLQVEKHEAPDAALLRACAKRLIPEDYNWSIVSAMGGRCFVTFQGFADTRD